MTTEAVATQNDTTNTSGATTAQTATNGSQQAQAGETLTFDKWLTGQPDTIKDLLDDHTSGLKSALDDERRERKNLAARLKELGKQADSGSELQKQLGTLTDQMTEADSKATFFEAAHDAGVKNLRLAWIAAKEFDLIGKGGKVDFAQLKTVAPELFTNKVTPAGNAGNGAGQTGVDKPDMNRALRVMAGRA